MNTHTGIHEFLQTRPVALRCCAILHSTMCSIQCTPTVSRIQPTWTAQAALMFIVASKTILYHRICARASAGNKSLSKELMFNMSSMLQELPLRFKSPLQKKTNKHKINDNALAGSHPQPFLPQVFERLSGFWYLFCCGVVHFGSPGPNVKQYRICAGFRNSSTLTDSLCLFLFHTLSMLALCCSLHCVYKRSLAGRLSQLGDGGTVGRQLIGWAVYNLLV